MSIAWIACESVKVSLILMPLRPISSNRSLICCASRPFCQKRYEHVLSNGIYNTKRSTSETWSKRRSASSAHFSDEGWGIGDVVHAATNRHNKRSTGFDLSRYTLLTSWKIFSRIGTATSFRRSSSNRQPLPSSSSCKKLKNCSESRSDGTLMT